MAKGKRQRMYNGTGCEGRPDDERARITSWMRAHAGTVICAAVLAVGIVVSFAATHLVSQAQDSAKLNVVVHEADGVDTVLPLDTDTVQIFTTSLGKNTVQVKDGAVCVISADCPNHDCMRQGKITRPGQQIICLAHKLWIELVADGQSGETMDVDAVPKENGADDDIDTTSR